MMVEARPGLKIKTKSNSPVFSSRLVSIYSIVMITWVTSKEITVWIKEEGREFSNPFCPNGTASVKRSVKNVQGNPVLQVLRITADLLPSTGRWNPMMY